MIKKLFSAALVYLMLLTVVVPFAAAQSDKNTEKVKAQVMKRNTGEKKSVKVKKLDGSTVKGYISRADADSFDVTNKKSGQVTTLNYADVSSVKRGGLSTTTIVTLAGIGAAAVVVLVIVGTYCGNEGGCF